MSQHEFLRRWQTERQWDEMDDDIAKACAREQTTELDGVPKRERHSARARCLGADEARQRLALVLKIKAGRESARVTSLAEIKANRAFRDPPLLKQGGLSVVPVTEAQYRILASH